MPYRIVLMLLVGTVGCAPTAATLRPDAPPGQAHVGRQWFMLMGRVSVQDPAADNCPHGIVRIHRSMDAGSIPTTLLSAVWGAVIASSVYGIVGYGGSAPQTVRHHDGFSTAIGAGLVLGALLLSSEGVHYQCAAR